MEKTAFDYLSEQVNNVGNGALDCHDKVCDMTNEIESAMQSYLSQHVKEEIAWLQSLVGEHNYFTAQSLIADRITHLKELEK